MTRSETITHLAAALARAQEEMPVAVFDATNPFLKSRYASLGAVIEASRPILAKHKLSLVQFPISETRRAGEDAGSTMAGGAHCPTKAGGTHGSTFPSKDACATTDYIGVESILTHESGEFVAERIVIALTEEKGKSRVQAAGSTLTYLRRYSWAAILGMYSDEDADGSSPAQAFTAKAATAIPPVPMAKGQRTAK